MFQITTKKYKRNNYKSLRSVDEQKREKAILVCDQRLKLLIVVLILVFKFTNMFTRIYKYDPASSDKRSVSLFLSIQTASQNNDIPFMVGCHASALSFYY